MNLKHSLSLLLLGIATVAAAQGPKQLPNGDQVNFDGTYYDFRAADGKSMIKLWAPPSAKPIRGILISGHGGGSGDSRDFARDANMKAVAARFGFGLVGLHTFPGGRVYSTGGKVFFDALNEFAKIGPHPELANVPFAIFGSSNGGAQAYAFVNYAPQRAICFVSNVTASFGPAVPVTEALTVPGVFVVGRYDPFSREEEGVRRVSEVLAAARANGARWSMVLEDKGHEDGVAFDVYVKLLERCIALRYPAGGDPGKGPVALRAIPEHEGWLADMGSWESGLTQIAPYGQYAGDRAKAAWLPDKDIAFVYRAAATRHNPLGLGVDEVNRVYNPNTDPRTMFSIGGPVVTPGRTIKLVADVREVPGWSKIEFFNGSRKLGQALAPSTPTLKVKVGAKEVIWCLNALVTTKSGAVRTSSPFYFAVSAPSLELRSKAEIAPKAGYRDLIGPVGSRSQAPVGYVPSNDKNVLVAQGLTADQERTFGATGGQISSFWRDVRGFEMRQDTHAREGSSFSIVNTRDARLTVKAVHSARGLYLYFEAIDNRFMNADPDPEKYNNIDAVDVLLDSRSSKQINDPANVTQAINAGWGLSLTTKQYQVAYGNDSSPSVMKRIAPDPWDLNFHFVVPMSEMRKRYGFQVRYAKIDRMTRVQEWFIPWSEIGLAGEPSVGTMLGFAPAYKDSDPGETSAKTLSWIDRTSPWSNAMVGGKSPRGWGDIEIGAKG